jgi:DNA-binding MarR family transcriptional regulator
MDRSPGRLLRDAHVALRAGLVRALEREGYDLSGEEWVVLVNLKRRGELSQHEIAERVGKDRPHVSRLLDRLQAVGLVERRPGRRDRRVKHVGLTEAGRAAMPRLTRVALRYLEGVFEGVTGEEYDAFLKCLDHIISRLQPAPR